MAQQLPLLLPSRNALGRGDFFVSDSNHLAVSMIDDWEQWPSGKQTLCGPSGSGKTHLAHVWAAMAGARLIHATEIDIANIDDLANTRIAIDDVDHIAQNPKAQENLFHLHNLCAARQNSVLFTGKASPSHWDIGLPDLKSRLLGTRTAILQDPDDALFIAVMAKQFGDRQLFPAPDVLQYLVTRCDRSFAMARHVVETIDRQSLAQKRNITRRFVADVFATLDQSDGLQDP